MPSLTFTELRDHFPKYDGKVVKLKFDIREQELTQMNGGRFAGMVGWWNPRRAEREYLRVIVPSEARDWFLPISTNFRATG